MNRPTLSVDHDNPERPSIDSSGTEWVQAMVTEEGEVLAGYTSAGDFRAFGSKEEIFDAAMRCITQALEIASERRAEQLESIKKNGASS